MIKVFKRPIACQREYEINLKCGVVGPKFAPRTVDVACLGLWSGAISLLLLSRPFRRFDDGIRSTDQPQQPDRLFVRR